MHGFDDSISLDLAPLSVIYLKPYPYQKPKSMLIPDKEDKKRKKTTGKKKKITDKIINDNTML